MQLGLGAGTHAARAVVLGADMPAPLRVQRHGMAEGQGPGLERGAQRRLCGCHEPHFTLQRPAQMLGKFVHKHGLGFRASFNQLCLARPFASVSVCVCASGFVVLDVVDAVCLASWCWQLLCSSGSG